MRIDERVPRSARTKPARIEAPVFEGRTLFVYLRFVVGN